MLQLLMLVLTRIRKLQALLGGMMKVLLRPRDKLIFDYGTLSFKVSIYEL